jgi:hypothetical protein
MQKSKTIYLQHKTKTMKKYRTTKKYQEGGIGPKNKKKVEAAKEKTSAAYETRAQEVEQAKMVGTRRAEDLKIADKIKKDVRSEVGPGAGRPSSNKGNVTLSAAKTQTISKDGVRKPDSQKYTRGQLAEQFSGQKQQPVYLKGETMGYAPGREISRGAGFTAKASMPSRDVQKSEVPTPAAKNTKPALSAEMQRRVAAGEDKSRAIGQKNFEFTMEDARRRGIRLNNGGMLPKIIKRK